ERLDRILHEPALHRGVLAELMNQTALHLLPEISARQVGRQEQPDALTYRIAGGAESAARHPFLDTLAALHGDGPGELSMTLWALQQVADEPMHVLGPPLPHLVSGYRCGSWA